MKVGFDHQIFSFQRTGGISRYFAQILAYSQGLKPVSLELELMFSNNVYLQALGYDHYLPPPFLRKTFKGSKWIIHTLNEWHQKVFFNPSKYDLIHPTYYKTDYLTKSSVPYILTVHDLTHEKFPELFQGRFDFTLKYKAKAIKNATHLIAISEHTKKDLMAYYGVEESKISVIYHGIPLEYESKAVNGLPKKYFLFIGDRKGYKNFSLVLKSLSEVSDLSIGLVCTGTAFSKQELREIAQMNLSDRVVQYTATEGELNFLYEHAQALVFPSLYEGFGFPIIEAMRAGCPLLLANASCFPEIAKDAARYFDPQDVQSLTSLLVETLEGSFNRQNYASAANRILPGFNIEKSVNHTLELYAKVCS